MDEREPDEACRKTKGTIMVAAFRVAPPLTGTLVALAGARAELKFRSKNSNVFSHGDPKCPPQRHLRRQAAARRRHSSSCRTDPQLLSEREL